MKHSDIYNELKKEREKLNKLVDEALKKGIPISKTDAIMEQSRKVDLLAIKIQKEMQEREKNTLRKKRISEIIR